MILIADSGSTKTHWCLLATNGQTSEFFTDGINPFFQTCDAMKNGIRSQLLPQIAHLMWVGPVTNIYFYGAGCTPEKAPYVEDALRFCFKKAEVVEVYSDAVGAARGLLGHGEGVACILGTGSNSCLYDGNAIVRSVPALGFILGDEGSGAVMGKRLVSDIYKNQLSEGITQAFLDEYHLTAAEVIENVYRKPFPNRYLAQFAKFCGAHLDNEEIHALVYDHFDQFAKRILRQYPGELPVGFVGSIAYHFRDVLLEVLAANHIEAGQILQSPMPGLIAYHK